MINSGRYIICRGGKQRTGHEALEHEEQGVDPNPNPNPNPIPNPNPNPNVPQSAEALPARRAQPGGLVRRPWARRHGSAGWLGLGLGLGLVAGSARGATSGEAGGAARPRRHGVARPTAEGRALRLAR